MGGENRDMKPVILKFGVTIALSLGGVIYLIFRSRRINKPKPPQSGEGKCADTSCCRVRPASDKHEELANNSLTSTNSRYYDDNDKFLLPELNELIKEFDVSAMRAKVTPRKDAYTPQVDREAYEREITNLTNLVRVLREREGTLEIQLLEYCGLKEQEAVATELRNRLKLNNMEAKIYSLKIESLQADNRRLEAQLSNYSKVVNELEVARGKIKLLKKKLKFETEQNKEHIMTLQQRVQLLQDKERQAAAACEKDDMAKMQKVKDLEQELDELRKSNQGLRVENSELVQKMDFTRLLANSVLEDQEAGLLKNEISELQQQNKDLRIQIEQLQAHRSVDVEQLVSLRWLNACLRHELRNYQPTSGNTTSAKNLSKTISPKSEAKAKRLIVEYANREGEKGIPTLDSDLDRWSSTCSADYEESPIDSSSSGKTDNTDKAKFMSRLKRLLTGKENNNQRRRRSSSLEDLSNLSTPTGMSVTSSQDSSRSSIDLGKLRYPRKDFTKDSGFLLRKESNFSRKTSSISNSSEENQVSETQANKKNSELMKYAKVLKDSSKEVLNLHKSSAPRRSL